MGINLHSTNHSYPGPAQGTIAEYVPFYSGAVEQVNTAVKAAQMVVKTMGKKVPAAPRVMLHNVTYHFQGKPRSQTYHWSYFAHKM